MHSTSQQSNDNSSTSSHSDKNSSQAGLEAFNFALTLELKQADFKAAFQYYQKALELGCKEAVPKLARYYMWGLNTVQIDLKKARELLESVYVKLASETAEKGKQVAGVCVLLGRLLSLSDQHAEAQTVFSADTADACCLWGKHAYAADYK